MDSSRGISTPSHNQPPTEVPVAPTAAVQMMVSGYQQMVASQPTQYLNPMTQFGGGNFFNQPPPPSFDELM